MDAPVREIGEVTVGVLMSKPVRRVTPAPKGFQVLGVITRRDAAGALKP